MKDEEFWFVAILVVWWYWQIGNLKKGLNPPSFGDFVFTSPYMSTAVKTGMITGVIALAVSCLLTYLQLYTFSLPFVFLHAKITSIYGEMWCISLNNPKLERQDWLKLLVVVNTGRNSSGEKFCNVQALPYWWEQRNGSYWDHEYCWFLLFLPSHNR